MTKRDIEKKASNDMGDCPKCSGTGHETMSYTVEAYRIHDGGMREAVGGAETLGDAEGTIYETLEEAEDAAEDLRDTWQMDWGLGECPTYVVEECDEEVLDLLAADLIAANDGGAIHGAARMA